MGVQYGRLASFVFAVCCCLAIVSIVNVAFATTRTEAMYGTMSNGKVHYKSAAQMRLDIQHTYSFQRVPDQVARYVPKNKSFIPSYTSTQLANMVKGVGKNTLGWAAVAGAVTATGWAIDELTNQVTKTTMQLDPNLDPRDTPINGYAWTETFNGQTRVASTPNGVIAAFGFTPDHDARSYFSGCCTVIYKNYRHSNGSVNPTVYRINAPGTVYDPVLVPVQEPVSDAEFNQEVLPKFLGLPNSQIETAINTLPQTPSLSDMLRDWLQDVANRSPDLSFDPATKSLTYTDPATGETIELETAQPDYTQDGTESFTDVAGTQWPSACEWFPKLCDWLDWTQEFEEPTPEEMPFEEINLADVQQDFNSGLGSGSCPAPVSFNYGGYSGNYEFTTACFAAETYFRPVILAMAAIMAGFIIVGATRKSI